MTKLLPILVITILAVGCASTGAGKRSSEITQLSAIMGSQLQGMRNELAAQREALEGMEARLDAMGAPAAPERPVVRAMSGDAPEAESDGPRTITFGPTPREEPDVPVDAPPIAIVNEWGRSLEVAEQFEQSSMKGIAAYVPADTPRAALERLGRDLRNQYDAYDNISIDVFDDEEAALLYAESPTANAAHRVLKISKDSVQDVAVVYHEGRALSLY